MDENEKVKGELGIDAEIGDAAQRQQQQCLLIMFPLPLFLHLFPLPDWLICGSIWFSNFHQIQSISLTPLATLTNDPFHLTSLMFDATFPVHWNGAESSKIVAKEAGNGGELERVKGILTRRVSRTDVGDYKFESRNIETLKYLVVFSCTSSIIIRKYLSPYSLVPNFSLALSIQPP